MAIVIIIIASTETWKRAGARTLHTYYRRKKSKLQNYTTL